MLRNGVLTMRTGIDAEVFALSKETLELGLELGLGRTPRCWQLSLARVRLRHRVQQWRQTRRGWESLFA